MEKPDLFKRETTINSLKKALLSGRNSTFILEENNLSKIKMFHLPEYYNSLSLRLSEVLDDIGVNERIIKMRRRSTLLRESLMLLSSGRSFNIFGSQSEGTTTTGLNSDTDFLTSDPNHYNVIQDYEEWKPGRTNLLMIQDDETSPGYCHLQLIRPDMPLPESDIIDKHCFRDADSRILLKNTFFDDLDWFGTKNGPAYTDEQPGFLPFDTVYAMFCESWPTEARDWSQRSVGKWPTEDMKRYAENSGCFVVQVGSKVSQTEYLEWRISTSKAERCLMFNLNTTQIKCFVLLKMILKTYLQPPLSSYMCKTVLLRCIEKTHSNMWQEKNLLTCLTVCLQALYISLLHKSCPHYFIPGNNLMAGQFSPIMKEKLLKSLHHILESQGTALYGIQTDDLGERLQIKMNPLYQSVQSAQLHSAEEIDYRFSGEMIRELAKHITNSHLIGTREYNHLKCPVTCYEKSLQATRNLLSLHKNGTNIERKAHQLIVPIYCSSLGSVLASVNIRRNYSVSTEALNWLLAGLNSDLSSGRLKLASVLYCAGDMLRAESILRETERLYRLDSVLPVCSCYRFAHKLKREYCRICYTQNEKAINNACAFCVRFFPSEMNCIPHELQYELFRSTEEELLHRDVEDDHWMNMAVVDSLPFLYFLQYKTYGNLQNYHDQQRALENLALTINLNENFGHRETALNLFGQCMEQENRLKDAVICYTISLNIRETNNAARYHLCILLADMQNNLY